ncbi:uncharacterized protein LOC117330784 [Pecten maximus]|uniref:uncharacterized protein LOC117330784 n=1 Tax=Pecten maximus TaxID=6579 RepID=UPI001458BBED|nr:uncharacterized protein LOC117330784 [Pecten maximus]
MALVESTGNPFGNNDVTVVDAPRLTYDKSVNRKVAKWGDIDDDEVWKSQPQQNLFSPEAPIKTKRTAQTMALTSFLQINNNTKKMNKTKSTVKKKGVGDDQFSLPTAGKKVTHVR